MITAKINTNYRVVSGRRRDYKSKATAGAAFLDGYDFMLQPENIPCSIRDFEPGVKVNIRYKRMTQVCTVVVPTTTPDVIDDHNNHMDKLFPKGWRA